MSLKSGIPVILVTAGPQLKYALPVIPVLKNGVLMTKVTKLGIPVREVTKFGIPIIYSA